MRLLKPCTFALRTMAGLLLVLAVLLGPAAAQRWKHTAWVTIGQNFIVPPLTVEAGLTGYTSASPSSITYDIVGSGQCKQGKWGHATWLQLRRLSTGQEWLAHHDWENDSYVNNMVLTRTLNLTAAEKASVVAVCNEYLKAELAKGVPIATVLGKEHTVAGPKLFHARFGISCKPLQFAADGSELAYTRWTLLTNPVLCKAARAVLPTDLKGPPKPRIPPGPQALAVPFAVTKAVLQAVPKKQSAECPAKVTINGVMETSGPGLVKFRVWHTGALGPVQQLSFPTGGVPRPVKFDLQIGAKLTGPSEGSPAPGPGGPQLAAASNPGSHSGCVRLEITQPADGLKKSEEACYTVQCKPQTVGGPGGSLAQRLPDLVVASFKLEGASGGTATVRNIGAAAAKQTQLKTRITVRGKTHTVATAVPPLAPGATAKIKVLFPGVLAGQTRGYTIALRVNDPYVVEESNKGNNGLIYP